MSDSNFIRELNKCFIGSFFEIPEQKEVLNPKLRDWINFFRKYGGRKFKYVLHLLNIRQLKWVRWRYKLKGRTGKIIEKLKVVL